MLLEERLKTLESDVQLEDRKATLQPHDSSASVSPTRSTSPSSIVPASSTRSSITNPQHHRIVTSNNIRSNMTPPSTNSQKAKQPFSGFKNQERKIAEKGNKSKREKEPIESAPKRLGTRSHDEMPQCSTERRKQNQKSSGKHQSGTRTEEFRRNSSKEHHHTDVNIKEDTRSKGTSKKHKIQRSDTIEEIGSARETEEKLALNKALESMCNPLHTFEYSESSIKSTDGMSYGYGRLEVNTSAEPKSSSRREKKSEKRDAPKLDARYGNRYEGTKPEKARRERETRPVTPNARAKEDPEHRETRSVTTSQHPNVQHTHDKGEKDFENIQSLVNIKDAKKQMTDKSEYDIHLNKDFSSSSLPASFSDSESVERNRKYKDDLVRSLTATPLSFTGDENRIDLNYFSSRQWFASDKTGQLSMSVRSVLSESQSSEIGPEVQDSMDLKQMLDGVEIAGRGCQFHCPWTCG